MKFKIKVTIKHAAVGHLEKFTGGMGLSWSAASYLQIQLQYREKWLKRREWVA